MKCITRYEMKFENTIIPARTECTIINKSKNLTADAPGEQLSIVVYNYDIKQKDYENKNDVFLFNNNVNKASLIGLCVHTNTQSVYLDAQFSMYDRYGLYEWQLEKIFGKDNVPCKLIKDKYSYNGKDSSLQEVIEYLEEEFTDWVKENCEFMTLTQSDIDKGYGLDGAEPGETILSDLGLSQFYKKCQEYKEKLETTGFTYNFRGGLIWD